MDFNDKVKNVFCQRELDMYKNIFEKEIEIMQKNLDDFVLSSKSRIKQIEKYENENDFKLLGGVRRDGKNKIILLIKRYPDGTQRDERYIFEKISELRIKLKELKEKYSGGDWTMFKE